MKHLFVTTALAAVLSVGTAQAQQTHTDPTPAAQDSAAAADAPAPAITPPEGYVESKIALTSEKLEGATVHDASGAEIGTVHGLVFADGKTSMQKAGAAPTMGAAPDTAPAATGTGTAATDTAATDTAASGTPATDMAATDTASPAATTATPGSTAPAATASAATAPDTTGTVDSSTASPQASAPATDSESDNVASGTDTGDNDRIDNVGSDATTVTPTDATTPPAQSAADAQPTGGMAGAEITHAVIDVGGFLGMGEHRVAIPVEDLKIYTKDTDLRIYLPWTKEQVEALPEFDEDAPAPAAQ